MSTASVPSTTMVARLEKEMVEMKNMTDSTIGNLQSQIEMMAIGLNDLTKVIREQFQSLKPADSQSAAAGHDK